MKINIAGTSWTFGWTERDVAKYRNEDELGDAMGCTIQSKRMILVDSARIPDQQTCGEVLMHELIHAIWYITGSNAMDPLIIADRGAELGNMGWSEEYVATRLESPLAATLRANPKIVEMIIGRGWR